MKFRLYTVEEIPSWCMMPRSEHFDDCGGCWSICFNQVSTEGQSTCESCQYLDKKKDS